MVGITFWSSGQKLLLLNGNYGCVGITFCIFEKDIQLEKDNAI